MRGRWSAGRRRHCSRLHPLPPCGLRELRRAAPCGDAGRVAERRSTLRLFCPRRRASVGRKPRANPPSGAASAARRRPSVQPLKAAGHNAGGRLAGASRVRGYKPRPRAPPPPHVRQCPAERPSRGVTAIGIYALGIKSREGCGEPNRPAPKKCAIVAAAISSRPEIETPIDCKNRKTGPPLPRG